jgi:putative tryptophan/tyrosine transport system substrate-binding protein
MDRRTFLALLASGLVARPPVAHAQSPGRVHRVGMLMPTTRSDASERRTAVTLVPRFLAELGYAQGRNLVLEPRWAGGNLDRLPALARELIQLRMDVIVAVGSAAVRACGGASSTLPIVFYGNFDPIALGLVKSLAKPGGNVTGVLIAPAGTLAGKKMELLKEAVRATRMAFLTHEDPGLALQEKETQSAATALGITLLLTRVRGNDYEGAFAAIAASRPEALFVAATTFFMRDRKRIIDLAARHRLPAIYEWPEQVEDGGLMSYGSDLSGTTRRVAVYVDRILRGDQPGDLPVEQPAEFQLAINLRTARALGLALPPSLVARADRVIE